ncbi:hypothetical protein ABPG74_006645 [Tetrahymena malaccensis]
MRYITVFVISCLLALCLAQKGFDMIKCQVNGVCNDANCGKSGSVQDNWVVSLDSCLVADCSKLSGAQAVVSTNACTSCFKKTNPYANYNNTMCVSTFAKFLTVSSIVLVSFFLLF